MSILTRRVLIAGAGVLALTLAAHAQTAPEGYPASYGELIAAAKKEGSVTIYTSTDSSQGDALVNAFKAKYPGIQVDYNDLGTNGAYNRAISEAAAKQVTVDVMWTSAMDQLMSLVQKGYADAYATPESKNLPPWAVYKDMLYATSIEPVGILYNKQFVKDAEAPQSRADLLKFMQSDPAKLKTKIGSFDPEKSGSGFLFFTNDLSNDPHTWDLVRAFGATDGKVYGSSGAMKEKVVSGEHILAFNVIASYALEWARENPQLGVAFTKDYTAGFSRVAFISKGAPHPNAARLFLDFMLTKDGQSALAAKGVPSLRTDVETGLNLRGLQKLTGNLKPIAVDEKLTHYMEPKYRAEFFQNWKKNIRG